MKFDSTMLLPLTEGGGTKWLAQAVADFNSLCESVKIDGQGRYEIKIKADKISELAKVGQAK